MEKQLVTDFSEEWFGEGFVHEPETETKTIEEKSPHGGLQNDSR